MKDCPGTDAILSIGDALEWDVPDRLHHLLTCEECRAEMDALRLTRDSLLQAAPIEPAVLDRITASVRESAGLERRRARVAVRGTAWVDAVIAGVAAPLVLMSSRVPIDDIGTVVLAFAMGAALMLVGRIITRLPALATEGTHA